MQAPIIKEIEEMKTNENHGFAKGILNSIKIKTKWLKTSKQKLLEIILL